MTAKELQEKCAALQRECEDKQMELRRQYAIEHNPVKVGDIVTDHYHTIRVEKMGFYGYPIPSMRYQGTELTKQGIPKKRQPVQENPAFQKNVISINGKPYKYGEDEI
jgi:hypothetical protein